LESERRINVDDDFWYKFSLEEWEDKLQDLGFDNPNISFSGFYSQGDGASFTCKSVDVDKFLTSQKKRGEFKALLDGMKSGTFEVLVSLDRIDHHYSHEYTVRVNSDIWYSYETRNYSAIQELEIKLNGLVLEKARSLMREIYRELEKEFEHLTSDEAVIDTIEANEYTFRADGTMENE
jgi:hypothetical protein